MRADFSNTQIQRLATHFVGNKHTDSTFFYSEEEVQVNDEELQEYLLHYFTTPFAEIEEFFEFYHESDEALNTIKHYAEKIFNKEGDYLEHSVSIAKHLYEISDAPNIKSGELHVALLDKVYLNDEVVQCIGLYKTEERDAFFQLDKQHSGYQVTVHKGISADKMDKGCIIFNTRKGMQLCVVDKTNKRNEAQYWRDKFLKIMATADEYHHTRDYLAATKEFIVKQIPQEYEVTKAQQADYLNRSLEFFRNNKQFDEQQFKSEVFQDEELITSFNGYKNEYQDNHAVDLNNGFDISESAVRRTARVFKSVIKLDKNFHVYVHGDRDLIERGYDEALGKHYYKIYFDNER